MVFLYSPAYMTVTLRTLDNVLRTFYATLGVMHRYCYSGYTQLLPHASNDQFLALSVTFSFFLFVHQISREPLNGFAPNSQERRVQSIARSILNVKVKDQRSRSPGTKNGFGAPITPRNERMVPSAVRSGDLDR